MKSKFDIIIIGGGFSGSTMGLSLLLRNPDLKIAIIEKSAEFPCKIGESNSDVTALFLRSLGIEHILKKQVNKAGLRFLFNETNSSDSQNISEFSSPALPGVNNGFHLDRKTFDQEILDEVEKAGAKIFRPANIEDFDHSDFENNINLYFEGKNEKISSRWLIDATGRNRFIHSKLNWNDLDPILETGSVMTHFKNIAPNQKWDLPENEYWNKKAIGPRSEATTHFMRKHSWWWMIKINEELTSIGCVFDKRHHSVENPEEFLDKLISEDADLSKITENASRGEVKYIEQLSYRSEKLYDKGIILLGDSAFFIDPLVSPGLELIAQQILWTCPLIEAEISSEKWEESKWEKYEKTFQNAYESRAFYYKCGYDFMDSFDLYSNWLRFANVGYFGKVVFPSIAFRQRLKYPMTASKIQIWGIKQLHKRRLNFYQKRIQKGIHSNAKPNTVAYSGIRVPEGLGFFFIPTKLFSKWVFHSFKINWKNLWS